ncbi:MAG: hypothetical protein ACTJLK_02355 [Anaplasma sp.]
MVALKDEILAIQKWLETAEKGLDSFYAGALPLTWISSRKRQVADALPEEQQKALARSTGKFSRVLNRDAAEVKERIGEAEETLADFKPDEMGEETDAKKGEIRRIAYGAVDKVLVRASASCAHLDGFLEKLTKSFTRGDEVLFDEESLEDVRNAAEALEFTKGVVVQGYNLSLKKSSAIVTDYLEGMGKHLSNFEQTAKQHASRLAATMIGGGALEGQAQEISDAVSNFESRIQRITGLREFLGKSDEFVKSVVSGVESKGVELQEGHKTLREGVHKRIDTMVKEAGDLDTYLSEFTKKIKEVDTNGWYVASLRDFMDAMAKHIRELEDAVKQNSTKVCKALGIKMPSKGGVFQNMLTAIRESFAMICEKVSLYLQMQALSWGQWSTTTRERVVGWAGDKKRWHWAALGWHAVAQDALKEAGDDVDPTVQELVENTGKILGEWGEEESIAPGGGIEEAAMWEAASDLLEMGEEAGAAGRVGIQKTLSDTEVTEEAGQALASAVSEGEEPQQREDERSLGKAEEVRCSWGGYSR